jgi:hypothetical protein
MIKEQYDSRLLELKKEYQRKVEELNAEYAIDNNTYIVGDLFRDHIGFIKIEKINVSMDHTGMPSCRYFGPEYKVDRTPKKSGAYRDAWQCNEKK